MIILDLNGNPHKVDIRPSKNLRKAANPSELQKKTKLFLLESFLSEHILEEFVIPETKMTVDFFLPKFNMVIEVQGKQHEKYTPFFHGSIGSGKFVGQLNRDADKRRWCELNNFDFIEIFTEEDLEKIE